VSSKARQQWQCINSPQAIVEGDPPDLPRDGYSDSARHFVHACLNKTPKLRPTYAALLQHPWLASLTKPTTITEEDEDEESASPQAGLSDLVSDPYAHAVDKEVAQWVVQALEKKKAGKMGKSVKPALHAAPLDAVQASATPPAKP